MPPHSSRLRPGYFEHYTPRAYRQRPGCLVPLTSLSLGWGTGSLLQGSRWELLQLDRPPTRIHIAASLSL